MMMIQTMLKGMLQQTSALGPSLGMLLQTPALGPSQGMLPQTPALGPSLSIMTHKLWTRTNAHNKIHIFWAEPPPGGEAPSVVMPVCPSVRAFALNPKLGTRSALFLQNQPCLKLVLIN